MVSDGGYYGLVVPISIVSTKRMAPLQDLLLRNSAQVEVANFAVRPATLFPGVDMNISIVCGIRLAQLSPLDKCRCLTTGYRRWYPSERPNLLDHTSFLNSTRFVLPGRIPKLGTEIELGILERMRRDGALLGSVACIDGTLLYYHSGGRYWRKAILTRLSSEYKPLQVTPRYFHLVLALLNSSLFYWYWIVFSDCYHVVKADVAGFPVNCATFTESQLATLKCIALELMPDYEANAVIRITGSGESQRIQKLYYPAKSKDLLDAIDLVLAEHYNFSPSETDYIVNFDRRFRGLDQ